MNPLQSLTLAACGLLTTPLAFTQVCESRLVGGDVDGGEAVGHAVALQGDISVLGAPFEQGGSSAVQPGAAYVQLRDTTGEWTEQVKLQPTTLGQQDRFGYDLDLDGQFLAVGAPGVSGAFAFDTGKVYIFRSFNGGQTWIELITLTPSDGATGDRFGASVALSGDWLVVGAPGHDAAGTDDGAAYVFRRSGTSWIQTEKLLPPASLNGNAFGETVAHDGLLAVVGGDQLTGSAASGGALAAYRRNSSQVYEYLHDVEPASIGVADFFGRSAEIVGDLLVAGAPNDDDVNPNAGAAYAFRYDSSARVWNEEIKLTGSGLASQDFFGGAVHTDGTRLIVGATGVAGGGAAWAFHNSGSVWGELRYLQPALVDNASSTGFSVAIDGDTALLGAPADGSVFFNSGAVWAVDVTVSDMNGNGVGDLCEGWAVNYCGSNPNSTGAIASITAHGSPFVADRLLVLEATDLPSHQFGYFLTSTTQAFVALPAGSQGNLCLAGTIGRFNAQVASSGSQGRISAEIDTAALPSPLQSTVLPGETWSFQLWYRDVNPSTTSNFTDAVEVAFQ